MAEFRSKTYANAKDKAAGVVGHLQVSGTVEVFKDLLKGKGKEDFDKAIAEALKK